MKKNFRRLLIPLCIILLILNTGLLYENNKLRNDIASPTVSQSRSESISISDDVTEVYQKVYESVVTVILKDLNGNSVAIGSGSVIANDSGKLKIITNNHVVDVDNTTIHLVFSNGQEVEATIVGKDNISDLALLTTTVDFDVEAISIGDSDKLQHGESVIAIGSPLDVAFSGTVTRGIVSGLNRFIETDTNGDGFADYSMSVIQTDTTINPGNSGGPLINMAGQLIGINTSKINMRNFEGMGFAIPVNEAILIIEQLEKQGFVERPTLGIQYAPVSRLTNYGREQLQLGKLREGIFITGVIENSSASKAGILENDVITRVNGQEITSVSVFTTVLFQSRIGDELTLDIIRDGKEIEIVVPLKK